VRTGTPERSSKAKGMTSVLVLEERLPEVGAQAGGDDGGRERRGRTVEDNLEGGLVDEGRPIEEVGEAAELHQGDGGVVVPEARRGEDGEAERRAGGERDRRCRWGGLSR
jgi:hypothetical protein